MVASVLAGCCARSPTASDPAYGSATSRVDTVFPMALPSRSSPWDRDNGSSDGRDNCSPSRWRVWSRGGCGCCQDLRRHVLIAGEGHALPLDLRVRGPGREEVKSGCRGAALSSELKRFLTEPETSSAQPIKEPFPLQSSCADMHLGEVRRQVQLSRSRMCPLKEAQGGGRRPRRGPGSGGRISPQTGQCHPSLTCFHRLKCLRANTNA